MWELKHALQLVFYNAGLRVTPLTNFSCWLADSVPFEGYTASSAQNALEFCVSDEFVRKSQTDQDRMKRVFAQREIKRCRPLVSFSEKQLSYEADIDERFAEAAELAKNRLREHDIDVSSVRYEIVDKLPRPYQDRPFSALLADKGDLASSGIEPGAYFVRDKMWPLFSRVLMLHEVVHLPISDAAPFELARGLEEGICELVGFFDLAPRLVGTKLASQLYFAHRMVPDNRMMALYRAYMRQMIPVLELYGWDGVYEMVKGGRGRIKDLEKIIQADEKGLLVPTLNLPTGDFSLVPETKYALLSPTSELYVNPASMVIFEHAKVGKTADEIAKETELPIDVVTEALKDLEDPVRYVGVGDLEQKVAFSDVSGTLNPLFLRAKF